MKAIILISSIFYILGLKISNKIDIVKKANPVEKIITNTISATKPAKSIHFNEISGVKAESDSLINLTEKDEQIENSK